LSEVDFAYANLESCNFEGSRLLSAKFEQTNLKKADFREANHYSINPALNKLSKAKFSRDGLIGLLDTLDIEIE